MSTARAGRSVALAPPEAFALWVDSERWKTFVDGFAAVESVNGPWPAVGAEIVWRSVTDGRGRVSETVTSCEAGARIETSVREERLAGVQTVIFGAHADGGTRVDLELAYKLSGGGPLRALVDLLFIRRAEGEALDRTLRRFAAEAASEAAL